MAGVGSASRAFDFLPAHGEMAARIHEFDWSHNPIGSPDTWPLALRTSVQLLLANRFPLLLWWGPDYISIYNDAYIPILGLKHPWALGKPVRECWSEIWHILRPLIDTPFSGGPATWSEDIELQINRSGFTEETHFTVAYSPVPDETAATGIGGVLATVHEITDKVLSERRTNILLDLGRRALEAMTAQEACLHAADMLATHAQDIPFALLYLVDSFGRRAKLAASCGLDAASALAPPSIELADLAAGGAWPLGRAWRAQELQTVENLGAISSNLPPGTWPEPPHTAVVVPVRSAIPRQSSGFLVAGLSSHLKFDKAYRDFLDLAASQIAIAISNAQAYEQERQRAESLAEIDRAKTAFFSNVSHEFRTPLTLMLGPLESMLAKDSPLPPEMREQASTAHRNSLRLLKLVNSLLDFSRIEAGRMTASYVPVDLAALTADLASNFRAAMESGGLEFVVDCPPLPQLTYVDREMWEKIVLNLLSNAFKFTFEGRVTVSMKARAKHAILTISDTGVGIPEAELPHLFERFHRVEGTRGRTYEGTGIGLALIQDLVKLHGGSVDVRSTLGQGTAFTVSIPFGSAHLPQEHIASNGHPPSPDVQAAAFTSEAMTWIAQERLAFPSGEPLPVPAHTPGPRFRILVVDDNADMREHIVRLLGTQYEIIAVPDGRAGLDVARSNPPDLVLSDVMLPGLDGFGLLAELRADPRTRELPIILLSARAGEEARTVGLSAGADEYLTKPFTAKELTARVAATLNLQRLRRDARTQFETLINQAPIGICLVDADFRIRQVNPTALPLFGQVPDLIGCDFDEVSRLLWPQKYAADFVQRLRHTLETGEPYVTPERMEEQPHPGVQQYYDWRIDRTLLPDGRFGVVCYFRDVSPQVQARQQIQALNAQLSSDLAAMTRLHQLSTRLTQAQELRPLLQEFIDAAIEITRADMGNIQMLTDGALRIVLQRGFETPFLDFFDHVDHGGSTCAAALRASRRIIVEDIATDATLAGSPEGRVLRQAGVRAVQSTPLISRSGSVIGMLSTHYRAACRLTDRDLRLLDLLARQAADLIENRLHVEALRASEERFRAFVTASSDVVYRMSPDWTEMRQLKGRDFVADTADPTRVWLQKYVHPDDQPQVMAAIQEAIRAKSSFELEHRVVRVDGALGWTFSRAVPLLDSQGIIIEWLGAAQDITARRLAEEQAHEAYERFHFMAESMPQKIFTATPNGEIDYFNRQWMEYTGLTFEQIHGWGWTQFIHPDEVEENVRRWRHSIETGEPFQFTHRFRRADGAYRWHLSRAHAMRDRDGSITMWIGSNTEIHDQKVTEEELRRANQDLEQFAYSASHDLQEPLRSVKIYSELLDLECRGKLHGETIEYLDFVRAGAERMEMLVHDLLAYTRASLVEKPAGNVDAQECLETALANLAGAVAESEASIQAGALPLVPVHATHLQQLFQNLVGNAIKYRRDGMPVVVRINAARQGPGWLFSVADNGIGIEPEYKERIFGLFKRLHTNDQYSGTGIGLAICLRIVEQYHGRIWVESEPGTGSTFYFTLPA